MVKCFISLRSVYLPSPGGGWSTELVTVQLFGADEDVAIVSVKLLQCSFGFGESINITDPWVKSEG